MKKVLVLISCFLFLFVFSGTVSAETTCPAEMVSYWRFDEGSGTVARDSFGTNDGTLFNDPIWTSGRVGRAVDFDGVDDYVRLPDVFPTGNSPRTIEAWFKMDVLGGMQSIAGWGAHSYRQASFLMVYETQSGGSGSHGLFFWGERYDLRGVTELVSDVWYHGVVTYDGSTVKLYLNGEFESSKNLNLNTQRANSAMGVAILDSFRKFNGQIDEVAIYNRALTPEEVQQHYENGLAGEPYCSPPLTLEERVTALEEALEEKEGRIEELENWRTTIDDWKVTINEQVDSLTNQINDIWEWLEEHIPRGLQKASSGGKGK